MICILFGPRRSPAAGTHLSIAPPPVATIMLLLYFSNHSYNHSSYLRMRVFVFSSSQLNCFRVVSFIFGSSGTIDVRLLA